MRKNESNGRYKTLPAAAKRLNHLLIENEFSSTFGRSLYQFVERRIVGQALCVAAGFDRSCTTRGTTLDSSPFTVVLLTRVAAAMLGGLYNFEWPCLRHGR